MRPLLVEIAGLQALGELVLDRRLEIEAEARAIRITEDDIDRERELLALTLSEDPNDSLRLLTELRQRQGLGEARFAALLRRNAILRALVADQVETNDAAVRRTFDLLYGEKRQARIIVADRLPEMQRIIRRIESGEPFGDAAVETSTDASAARGGLLPPISRADPTWPAALRDALWRIEVGEMSAPVMIDNDFALIRLDRIIEPARDVSFEAVREEMIRLTRRNQERVLMQDLAQRLVDEADVTIVDDALHAAWSARRGE